MRTRSLFLPGEAAWELGARVEVSLHLPDGMTLCLTGAVMSVVSTSTAPPSGASVGIDEQHAVDLMLLEELAQAAQEATYPLRPQASTREADQAMRSWCSTSQLMRCAWHRMIR